MEQLEQMAPPLPGWGQTCVFVPSQEGGTSKTRQRNYSNDRVSTEENRLVFEELSLMLSKKIDSDRTCFD